MLLDCVVWVAVLVLVFFGVVVWRCLLFIAGRYPVSNAVGVVVLVGPSFWSCSLHYVMLLFIGGSSSVIYVVGVAAGWCYSCFFFFFFFFFSFFADYGCCFLDCYVAADWLWFCLGFCLSRLAGVVNVVVVV